MSNSAMCLFYSPGACSLASHIALEETGAPFEARRVNFAEAEQRSPAYLAVNPKGRVPALRDGDFVITENPAILRYIARQHRGAGLWPEDPQAEARCAEWLAWCSSGLHIAYAHIRRPERYAAGEAAQADVVARGFETTRAGWEEVERKLAGSGDPWAAGAGYSVADPYLLVLWTWGRGQVLGYDMAGDFPAWTDHARRMGERPAVRRALAREGIAAP
ncbi:glutathione S-transferase N-terminal domain-containing protein [Enterovirga sp.]|jgi:glutathione S-transferase|uniref:glutathione S-transferase family protein n=1 Tax=Enterovirga sp. TaxID=2026350 RepID=UPI0026176029|nr:glutathione S-transferase N-terminal domain-containing protein [Enterovirga sp.]MDB5590122.1 Glutathione S-transferase domain protein [Enterovirga sp.]